MVLEPSRLGQMTSEPRFYVFKNRAYVAHKPTFDRAKESALVHCYFALRGEVVEVLDPNGTVAWGPQVVP